MQQVKPVTAAAAMLALGLAHATSAQAPRTQAQAPQIAQAVLNRLPEIASARYASTLLGLYFRDGDTTRLRISSNRQLIAFSHAQAAEKAGKFTPPASMRRDVVVIECGDPDLGERFDCARVAVRAAGKAVRDVSYVGAPRTFRNALGASWSARVVTATYAAGDLREGFSVTYGDGAGTEWTVEISNDQADFELLLDLGTAAAPDRLVVEVKTSPFGWRVDNRGSQSWPACTATIGSNRANIGALVVNGSIIIGLEDFRPGQPDPQTPLSAVAVACTVNGRTYQATP